MADAMLQQVLQATLDSNKDVRQAGEAELQRMATQPAAIALQKYVGSHWSEASDKFEAPLVPQELRPRIREALAGGLGHAASGIRGACAYAVALIAKYDWPDFWPTLMDDLITLLKSGEEAQLEGAMDVVTELVREDLGQDQLPAIASNLLPALLDILRNTNLGWLMRSKTLANFEEIISMFTTVREEHPQAVKQALEHFGPTWLAEMDKIVSEDIGATLARDAGLLELRNASFRVFSALNRDFAKFFAPYRIHLLQVAVQNLIGLVAPFHQYCIQSNDRPTLPDNYDETLIFDSLITDIFDFIARAGRHLSAKPLFVAIKDDQEVGTDLLRRLLEAIADLSQMSVAALEDLDDEVNVNQFLAEEDDDSGVITPRTAGHDLVASIIDQYPRAVATNLQDILVAKVQSTVTARQAGHDDWWQSLEAMLAMLIALSDDLEGIVNEDNDAGRPPTIALGQLYTEVVANILQQKSSEGAEVLDARALLFAAAYAASLPKDSVNTAFSIAISSLEQPDASQVAKMSATKAIKNFCRHVAADSIRPHSQHIMSLLLPNLRDITDEMLYLVLETLGAILAIDKNALNPQSTRTLAEIVFATWLQNSTDPVATAIVAEVLEVVAASSPQPVVHTLVVSLCPRLAATIAAPVTSEYEHLPAEAVQLANSLIRTRGGPLEVELISTVTAAVMHCLQQTEDMHVVQHGMFHLTQVVRKDCEKLLQWRGREGASGMDTVLQLLSKFLDPSFPESGGIFVGDLIIHLLRKASSAIGPILPDLLQALVSRLAHAKLPSFIQALVLPFAYLCSTEHTQATIDLLSSLPNPAPESASSALQLVLRTWCEITDDIAGSWNIRVSALGLTRLYTNPSPALREVAVRGDLIIDETNRNTIMTRSKAKANPNQYTPSPFPVKCLKLLLKELQSFKQSAAKGKKVSTNTLDIDEDDGDDEWDDDDDLAGPEGKGEFDFLSSWLDNDGGGDMDAQDDDEDLRSDPIAQIDMVDHLTNVLRHCYSTNDNGMHEHINGLNEVEKGMLRSVLTM